MKFETVMTPARKHYPSVASEYFAAIVPKKSIAVYRGANGSRPETSAKIFEVGDWAEYDSYNLHYVGKIVSITAKTVSIDTNAKYAFEKKPKIKRMNIHEFAWRNYDFDHYQIAAKNADTMLYI